MSEFHGGIYSHPEKIAGDGSPCGGTIYLEEAITNQVSIRIASDHFIRKILTEWWWSYTEHHLKQQQWIEAIEK